MPHDTLTARELAIMKVIWETPNATVRDVHEVLARERPVAYTTVMTLMNILQHKGFLTRRKVDRAYVYRAARPRKQVLRALVREFIDRVFDGTAQPLRVYLVKDQPLSADERRELQHLIDALED
jgi:BlaI family transcriptional regulator, penicillinase repressor